MSESWIPEKHDFTDFFKLPVRLMGENENGSTNFTEKLSHLSLLYDVPFAYLVPAENMLKLHEIRFFWIDSNWVRIFLDGALSIGRNATIDDVNDTVFLKKIYENAISRNVNIRRKLRGKDLLSGVDHFTPCTGFLLRSPLVEGWRGLEFSAFGDTAGNETLHPLRLETLSQEILLGLYSGVIRRLDIKQPPEGFHYGFTKEETDKGRHLGKKAYKLKKCLRSIEDGKLLPGKTIQIEERGNRVINFAAAARSIKNELFPGTSEEPDSAHIALEMIQNPYMLNIKQES